MKAAMRFKLALILMLSIPSLYALEANNHAASGTLDLIEFLGELDEEDAESLDAAMTELELKKNAPTSAQETKK
jgi:hypothetical protein